MSLLNFLYSLYFTSSSRSVLVYYHHCFVVSFSSKNICLSSTAVRLHLISSHASIVILHPSLCIQALWLWLFFFILLPPVTLLLHVLFASFQFCKFSVLSLDLFLCVMEIHVCLLVLIKTNTLLLCLVASELSCKRHLYSGNVTKQP